MRLYQFTVHTPNGLRSGGGDDRTVPIEGDYAQNGGDEVAPRLRDNWNDYAQEPDDTREKSGQSGLAS